MNCDAIIYENSVSFSERKSFERPSQILEDIINTGLKSVKCEDGDWVCLAYVRHPRRALVNTAMII
jgi:hypothetical protein